MKTFIASILVVLVGGISYNTLHNHNDCAGFLPENDLQIPVGTVFVSGGGITEAEFNAVIDRVEGVYTEIVEARGKKLDVRRLWTNDTVNASAQQIGDTWRVNMYGGLARHPTIGVEAFTTVLCHEMGHHLGGAPKYGWSNSWASNEGQSDYYATTKCMRKLFTEEENSEYITNVELDEYAKSLCDHVFGSEENRLANCYRSAVAGQDIAFLFQALRKMDVAPKFNTPDTKVVKRTANAHPMPQCRLDTYFHGALCNVSHEDEVSDTDQEEGVCNRTAEFSNPEEAPEDEVDLPANIGTRPLCWFKPSKDRLPLAGI